MTLLIPGVKGVFTNHQERSSFEKRELHAFPQAPESVDLVADYFSRLNSYLEDHFGFAVEMNRLFRRIRFYIFHDDPSANVTRGRDGYIFLNAHGAQKPYEAFINLCQGRDTDTARRAENWGKLVKWLGSRGYRTVLAIPASKPVLYPEKLPHTVPLSLRQACMGYRHTEFPARKLMQQSLEEGWLVYHPFEQMYQLRNTENYYPKENFHWNGLSTHLFAKELLPMLGINLPPDYSLSAYENRVKADMAGLAGFQRIISITDFRYSQYGIAQIKGRPELVTKYYERARNFNTFTARNALTARTALLLSDSFGYYLSRHVAPAYARVIHVEMNHIQESERERFFTEFIDLVNPDDIILLVHDAGVFGTNGASFTEFPGIPDSIE